MAPVLDQTAKKPGRAKMIEWTQECQSVFERIKLALLVAPVLTLPDPDKTFEFVTDGSVVDIRAVLIQDGNRIA